MMENLILQNAVLYVDVYCYRCERSVALSNTTELDGRQYCYRCYTYLEPPEELLKRVLKEIEQAE